MIETTTYIPCTAEEKARALRDLNSELFGMRDLAERFEAKLAELLEQTANARRLLAQTRQTITHYEVALASVEKIVTTEEIAYREFTRDEEERFGS